MLISPPFLTPRAANQADSLWVDEAMQGGEPGQGGYPVSHKLGWHGGIHLEAPGSGLERLLVRSIADGTVVYIRKPTERPDPLPEDHPLNYRGWTSDGCVVIRHETEIGADAQGRATTVTFYSITMHLHSILPAVRKGRPINRKAEIGQAGYIYGDSHKIHFEIVCDDDNLQRLVGRASGELNTGADGRIDAVYGELYFRLPSGTAVYAEEPLKNNPVAHRQPPALTPATALPPIVPLAAVHTTASPLFVGLRYSGGEGAAGNRGDAYLSTYREDGTSLGTALEENEAEYNLYRTATNISNAYPAAARPAPCAVYELLRFGRVIGPDALAPANVPHWRRIRYDGGEGWVNLNATGVTKLSDADFPQWKSWTLIDDSADLDSRCDSPTVKGWLDEDKDGKVVPNEAVRLLPNPDIQAKMRRTICKLPTEWEQATVGFRWGWLQEVTEENSAPLSGEDFLTLREHIEALAFWEEAAIGISSNHWHFQAREFIRQFKQCGWMDEKTLRRVYPNATDANVARYRLDLNRCCRKVRISGPTRLGHFFGQAAVETAQLRYTSELFNGDPFTYFRHYAKAKNFAGWLGNVEWDDGGRFRGRGFKQMTGRDNYANYWLYRGWLSQNEFTGRWWRNPGWWGIAANTVQASQYNTLPIQDAATVTALIAAMNPPIIDQPDIVLTDTYTCIDTAGWFWAKNQLIATADVNDTADMTRKIRGDGANVGVTTPWPAAAHYPDRLAHTQRIITLIGDQP